MIEKFVIGRTSVFIDAANILYSQQTLKWEVDYKKLIKYFKENTKLVSAHFYSGKRAENKVQEKFFKKLQEFGYIVTTKEVKWIKDRDGKTLKGKGNLDIELALDVFQQIQNYDTAVLLSGDSDFAVLINLIRKKGKKVIVLSTKYHVSKEVIIAANKYINLKYLRGIIERKKKL